MAHIKKHDSLFQRYVTLGAEVQADFVARGFSLLRASQLLVDCIDEVTQRAGGPQQAASKVVACLPSPQCEPGLSDLNSEELQQHGLALNEVALAAEMDSTARLVASAVLADCVGERWRDHEAQLLKPAPYSVSYGSSLLRVHRYSSSTSSAGRAGGSSATRGRKRALEGAGSSSAPPANAAHEDRGVVTLIACHHADGDSALEVLAPDGIWQTVPLEPGLVAVLPGAAFEAHLGDRGSSPVRATTHRVRLPRREQQLRVSVAFHLQPHPDAPCPGQPRFSSFGAFLADWVQQHESLNALADATILGPLLLRVAAVAEALRSSGEFSIFVKTLTGKTIHIQHVSGQSTVRQVMDKVEALEGVPVDDQRLFFEDSRLGGDRRLDECGLVDGSTVQLFLSMVGD